MSQQLASEISKAAHLLESLTKHSPPERPLGELNPKCLRDCKGAFFYHTTKVGLGVSLKWGSGILVVRKDADKTTEGGTQLCWSAPVFFKVQCASLGVSAGMSSVQTLLLFGTSSALDEFISKTAGNGSLVLGQDVKIAAVSDLGWGALENGGGSLDGGLLHTDILAVSADVSGVMLDWSIVGGSVMVDEVLNHTIYGPEATPKSILEGRGTAHLIPQKDSQLIAATPVGETQSSSAQECHVLFEAMDEIIAHADADPRKFSGYERKWKSHSILATASELRKLE